MRILLSRSYGCSIEQRSRMDIELGDLKHEIRGVQRQGQICCIEQEINGRRVSIFNCWPLLAGTLAAGQRMTHASCNSCHGTPQPRRISEEDDSQEFEGIYHSFRIEIHGQ
jgi:hypothetical protein